MLIFLVLTLGNYKGSTWQASWGKTVLPTPDLVHRSCTAVSNGSWSQNSRSVASHANSHIYIHSPGTFIPRFLYLRPQVEVCFKCLCWGLLILGRRESLEDTFFMMTHYVHPDTCPHLSSLRLPQGPYTAGIFCSGLPQQWEAPPLSMLIHRILGWHAVHREKEVIMWNNRLIRVMNSSSEKL